MRSDFDLDPSLVYLNAANQSLCPRSVRQAVVRYQDEYERNPTEGMARAWGELWESQKALARFLGANPHDLFLRTNVTQVLNELLLGIPLPPGSEILVSELEYGAIVNICVLRAKRENLKLRVLSLPTNGVAFHHASQELLVDSIVSQIGPATKLVLLSHVVAGTGLVIPIREVGEALRAKGVFLVVDGAYAPGAFDVDFGSLEAIDFYGCSLYKWMLGPKGTAFGWVNPRWQKLLQPVAAGWSTFESFGPFSAHGEQSRFQETFLMAGCRDFAPFSAIKGLIEFWEAKSPREIFSRREQLQQHLLYEIERQLNWRPLRSRDPRVNGPLTAFCLPPPVEAWGPQLAACILEKARIQLGSVCLRGEWHAVLSPHVHNETNEITRAVSEIAKLFRP